MRMKQDAEISDQYGFTLIELMVTLSVAIIVLSVGVPNYRGFVQDSLLVAQSNSFHSAIALTKSEAIKRSSRVTLCPSSNGTSCTGGTTWSNGWIVFINPNGNAVVDAGEEVLQVRRLLEGVAFQVPKIELRSHPMASQWDQMAGLTYATAVAPPIPKSSS